MRFCVLGLFGFLQKAGKNLKYCDKHCPVFNNPIRIGIFANLSSEFCLVAFHILSKPIGNFILQITLFQFPCNP